MKNFNDRFKGEPYFALRKTEAQVKRSVLKEKAEQLGVGVGQLTLQTVTFHPVAYEDQETPRLLGAEIVLPSNLDGPVEITEGVADGNHRPDGRFVCPIRDNELDAITFFADLHRDGSPYMPDGLVDEANETSGILLVVPRPRPKRAAYWPHAFAMAEDTFVSAASRTPLKDYLENHGVTRDFPTMDYPTRQSITDNFPCKLDRVDTAALMHLSGILQPDIDKSTFRVD